MKYNQVYGKYCFGTGSWLGERNLFKKSNLYNNFVIDSYKTVIKQDLLRMNNFQNLKNKVVLDVGSGRNTLAFQSLGVKKIYHVDISKYNHRNLKSFLNNKKKKNIQTFNLNLEENEFKKLKIKPNLVYLHGVIHHMKTPHLALRNIDDKLSKNGLVWIHFYQYGSLSNICLKLIKKILSIKKIDIEILYSFFKKKLKLKDLDVVIDTFGCDYIKIYTGDEIFNLMKKNGYELIFSKDVYLKQKASIRTTTQSGILVFKKKLKTKKEIILREFNYLDENKFVIEDYALIKKLKKLEINFFYKLKKKIKLRSVLKVLYEIVLIWRNDKLLKPYFDKERELVKLFNKIIKIL
jgi:hypothetical protein